MKIYFDQYVRNALYDKGGYYHDYSSVKEKRDFITSPQVSDLFGFFVSRYISLNFSKFFKKKDFSIVELGSNDGLLSLQILDYLKSNYSELYDNINYIIHTYKVSVKLIGSFKQFKLTCLFNLFGKL